MKKYVIGGLIALLFIGGGIGAYLILTNQSRVNAPVVSTTSSDGTTKLSVVDACDILSEEVVKENVGQAVEKVSTPQTAVATADIAISNCNYVTRPPKGSTEVKLSGVSLLVRVAKTTAGGESNKVSFMDKPSDVENVDDIGDDAFYNPQFRQLHVLKGNNWYIITAYKDSILNSTLESNKTLAKKLNFQ